MNLYHRGLQFGLTPPLPHFVVESSRWNAEFIFAQKFNITGNVDWVEPFFH